jgi:hypothetical protein
MAEFKRTGRKKQEETDQKRSVRQKDSQPLADKFHSWEQDALSIGKTPFTPSVDKHTKLLAMAPSDEAAHNLIMRLQNTYGNHYVQRLLNSKGLRAKLAISDPADIYEQEADRVAEMVISTMDSQVQRQTEEEEEEPVQTKVSPIQRQEEEEEVMPKVAAELQRQTEEEEEEPVQTKPVGSQPVTITDDLETRIDSARGGGQPLSEDVKKPMEQTFGADFSGVHVHTNTEANILNQQLGAKAFTTGQDIYFRENEYSPVSESGRKLIAHELTHVVQQNTGRLSVQRTPGRDPYFNKDNLKFLTLEGGRQPTLYFEGPGGRGRLRQQHPSGPKMQAPDGRARRFFESWKPLAREWGRYKKAKADEKEARLVALKESFASGVAQPTDGYQLVEFIEEIKKMHFSGGIVSTAIQGYTDDDILKIKLACQIGSSKPLKVKPS